jgi:hypothetical protein
VIDGVEVVNGDINVNVLPSGDILSFGNSFYSGSDAPAVNGETFVPKMTALEAMQSFSKFIGEELSPRNKVSYSFPPLDLPAGAGLDSAGGSWHLSHAKKLQISIRENFPCESSRMTRFFVSAFPFCKPQHLLTRRVVFSFFPLSFA